MERWERVGKPPARGCRDYPSFSSTLLDSIYRSIDETDDRGATKETRSGGAPDSSSLSFSARKKQSTTEERSTPAVTRSKHEDKPDRRRCFNSTSSSSDCSSYGGFSSSEAESAVHTARLKPIRTGGALPARSDRTRSDLPPPPPNQAAIPEKKKNRSSIGSKFRDLRKGRAPASPGARLASFLNSLFAAAGNPKKVKTAPPPTEPPLESACSTESYFRSCLSKTPSSRGRQPSAAPAPADGVKRSVRFYPVSVIVDEDCRPCGQKCIYGGDPSARPQPPPAGKKRVEELIRGFVEEEEEEEDGASDSSSDLFELENLTAIGRYRYELPVYETTHLGTNRAIAQGLVL